MSYIEILQFSELRFPKKGEWYLSEHNEIRQEQASFSSIVVPIVTRHKIDVPEGAIALYVYPQGTFKNDTCPYYTIPLSQSPVRCRWYRLVADRVRIETTEKYTRAEIQDSGFATGDGWWQPIPGTEE